MLLKLEDWMVNFVIVGVSFMVYYQPYFTFLGIPSAHLWAHILVVRIMSKKEQFYQFYQIQNFL